MGRARPKPRSKVREAKAFDDSSIIDELGSNNNPIKIVLQQKQLTQSINCDTDSSFLVGEIVYCDPVRKRAKEWDARSWGRNLSNNNTDHCGKRPTMIESNCDKQHHRLFDYYQLLTNKLSWKPTTTINNDKSMEPSTKTLSKMHIMRGKLSSRARRLNQVRFPFQVAHHDGHQLASEQWECSDELGKDFLNRRQFKLTCLTLALLAFAAACSPMETDAFVAQQQQGGLKDPSLAVRTAVAVAAAAPGPATNDRANGNTRSLSSYNFKDWVPVSQQQRQQQPVTVLSDIQLGLGSPPALDSRATAESSSERAVGSTIVGSTNALPPSSPTTPSGSATAETQLMAPTGSNSVPDHMLTAASKKKKMKMMKKKKKMEKKHKEWKKGKKHKKKKYESKKKKGGSSKKKKGKKEKKKWGMEKKGHKKKGNFKKKKWGSKKKMKKGHKKGKKGHKMLKDKGHKKKGFKKVYHKEEWGKKKKWHDIKREKKWNTKAKKWKKKWHQEKGKKYKGKHMKKYHKKNKHGKKYKKEKKSKWKKHKGEKFKKGHKKKKEEYSKKKEGGKKKKMKKMKKEMKKKKKG